MRRIVVLGTGTGVGKTYFTERLIRALADASPDEDVVGIKPIETGLVGTTEEAEGVRAPADDERSGRHRRPSPQSPQPRSRATDAATAADDEPSPRARNEGAMGARDGKTPGTQHGAREKRGATVNTTGARDRPTSGEGSRGATSTVAKANPDAGSARIVGPPPKGSDAWSLERVSRGTPIRPHPLLAFAEPVSAHLAARRERARISVAKVARALTLHATTLRGWQVIETAGGAFSPLGPNETNFDLALALDPSIWVVVAPDALGVLHDVRATLLAMRACGREPDHLVLCAAREHDASGGTNAAELPRVGLPKLAAILGRDDDSRSLAPLIRRLFATPTSPRARPKRKR
ncbi:MAG TPA: AAA family ATPase [Polyangiaceae bacterium]|jgi:dethiobiotin synthetase|nr:AAA family ATPase [Polyangiaceae bacterium]